MKLQNKIAIDKVSLPLLRPFFDQEEIDEIKKVFDSGWVAQGPKVKEFERCCAKYLGCNYAIAVTNCTAALHLALLALGIKKGDDVLVADYTFPATGHSVLYCGARPVFVDINRETYNLDPVELKKKLTKRSKVIMPVHTFGQPADMDPIMEFAEAYDLKVVEDAACALGAKYKGNQAGTIGHIGCYSFHARKGVTTGEGGMVVTNDESLAESIRYLSVFGMKTAWERKKSKKFSIPIFTDLGYNYKMSDIAAAIGVVQLKRLDKILRRKRQLAKYWDTQLQDVKYIKPPYIDEHVRPVYQAYVTLIDKGIDRNGVIDDLAMLGIQTNIGTYASHIQPVYKSKDRCPNSLEVFKRALSLPLYYGMMELNIDLATSKLRQTLERRR